jgi:hypothetical protein
MSFTLDNIAVDGNIEVIIRADSALNVTDEEYDEYIKSGLDEGKLKYHPSISPTRWVMKKSIPYRLQQRIDNQKVRFEKGEAQVQMAFTAEEVRASLVEIKYEDDVPLDKRIVLKRDGDGMVEETLMGKLNQAGVTMNLFNARNQYLEYIKSGGSQLKKD